MKKLAMLTLAALAALNLSGCVKMHSDAVIREDGSGTASLNMSLSPTAADLIKEMKELGMDKEQDMEMPSLDDFQKDKFAKAAKGHGVEIKKFDRTTVDGRDQLDVVMEFKDLEGLSFVMANSMGEGSRAGYGIFETADGNYLLKQAFYDFPVEEMEAEEDEEAAPSKKSKESAGAPDLTEEEKAQRQMALMGKLMGAMAELDVRLAITVPGEIIESNAPTVEGNTSIWSINAGNMMSQQGTDMEPVIKFSSEGLKIKALKE
jgi:hypothetical protein